jgi:hypothetical protein
VFPSCGTRRWLHRLRQQSLWPKPNRAGTSLPESTRYKCVSAEGLRSRPSIPPAKSPFSKKGPGGNMDPR